MDKAAIIEMLMLFCFGASWPISIYKTLRTKMVLGKSPAFMLLIALGYVFGIIHKYYGIWDWVAALYGFNLLLVLIDLSLYYHYLPRDRRIMVQ
jgi:hypothetical protein